jgi:hypothetical protein
VVLSIPRTAEVFSTISPDDPVIIGKVSQKEYTVKSSAYLANSLFMSCVDADPVVRSLIYSLDEVSPVNPQYFKTLFSTAA